jgi:hypothetical protein
MLQRRGEPGDDAVLEREDVVHEAVDLLAAEVRARRPCRGSAA